MSDEMYSVEQVAERLSLHVRTVRTYVREGRLKAVRIGKQYRIAAEDLMAFTGRPAGSFSSASVRRDRHVEVSSIVEIDAISPDAMSRVSNMLLVSANGRDRDSGPLRIETVYDETRARMKVILVGGLDVTASMLKLIRAMLEA